MHTAQRIIVAFAVVAGGATGRASAEASHHQGTNPGQLSVAGVDRLAGAERPPLLDVRVFTSFLHASEKLDDDATRVPFSAGGSIRNLGLNVYVGAQVSDAFSASVFTGVQRLEIDSATGGDTIVSLADTQLTLRYRVPLATQVDVIGAATTKIPGTYPESEATGTKQVDQEAKVLVAIKRLGSDHVALVAGLGYKLRLSTIQDEITPTLLIPIRLGRLTATPSLTGGIAIGAGARANDALTTGLTLSVRLFPRVGVDGGYYQTLYGHNVVAAHAATLGVATSW